MATMFLIKTLSFIALFLKLVHSKDHTFFSYHTFTPTQNDLTFQGAGHIPLGSNILSLTQLNYVNHSYNNAGRVLFARPVKFWERGTNRQATFETRIKFRITPMANGAAEGLAFFIAPVGTTIPRGATGGHLGLFDGLGRAPALFAVEFDTFYNTVWDPPFFHIGVDIESRVSKEVTNFYSGTGEWVTATIMYSPNTKTIKVLAETCTNKAELEYVFDLKTILPEQVQVGISSASGTFYSLQGVHDVSSWSFFSDLQYYDDNNKAYIQQVV